MIRAQNMGRWCKNMFRKLIYQPLRVYHNSPQSTTLGHLKGNQDRGIIPDFADARVPWSIVASAQRTQRMKWPKSKSLPNFWVSLNTPCLPPGYNKPKIGFEQMGKFQGFDFCDWVAQGCTTPWENQEHKVSCCMGLIWGLSKLVQQTLFMPGLTSVSHGFKLIKVFGSTSLTLGSSRCLKHPRKVESAQALRVWLWYRISSKLFQQWIHVWHL